MKVLSRFVLNCVSNQSHGHWLLANALQFVISIAETFEKSWPVGLFLTASKPIPSRGIMVSGGISEHLIPGWYAI